MKFNYVYTTGILPQLNNKTMFLLNGLLQGAQLLARVAEDSSAAFDQITGACLEEKLSAVSN
ncbi:hypothetical protein [Moorena sp. SIO2C4]|uniref:hypothetical protein n=1 Tax=Moorena sp. SIO2C4 TaxID=2607824 RepID=UPI002579C733|nr:hypothetical protein [Moorena sp. SIO2C4]